MHQIKTQNKGEVWQRDASCCCEKRVICVGHEWKFARVAEKMQENTTQSSKPKKRRVWSNLSNVNKE